MLASGIPLDIAVGRAELAATLAATGKRTEARALLALALPILREQLLPHHINRAKFEVLAKRLAL